MSAIFEKKSFFQLSGSIVNGVKGFMPMFHPHAELLYVIKGAVTITVDGVTHTVDRGEIAIIFPYLTHAYESAPDAEAIILLFDPAATVFDKTMLTKKPTRFFTENRALHSLLERCVTMLHSGRTKTATAYLNAVIGELLEVLPLEESGEISRDITLQILNYCSEHYTEEITVSQVANALYISQSYVSKVFSNKLKYNFREYINTLRIHKAQSLLKESNKSILQIMGECGFKNQSSFNRIFREICGVCPKEFRAM